MKDSDPNTLDKLLILANDPSNEESSLYAKHVLKSVAEYLLTARSIYITSKSGEILLLKLEQIVLEWYKQALKDQLSDIILNNLGSAANLLSEIVYKTQNHPESPRDAVYFHQIREVGVHLYTAAGQLLAGDSTTDAPPPEKPKEK